MNKSYPSFFLGLFLFTSSIQAESLRFIADFVPKNKEIFKGTEIGGISGIHYNENSKTLLAISDDRSQNNPARFYEFELSLDNSSLKVTPKEVITLKNKDGKNFEKRTIDFEGISLINDQLYITSEGEMNRTPQINPEIYVFDMKGNFVKNLAIPEAFLFDPDKTDSRGVRNNLALESLSSLSNKNFFFIGNEEALIQDGSISTPNYQSQIRFVQYENGNATKQFAYELDKVEVPPVGGITAFETGVSDILLIDEKSFYSIERSYLPLAKKNIIKIFKVKITEETTDISSFQSLKNQKFKTLEKELLLNLEGLVQNLSKDHPRLDNIEAITYGPNLKNGNRTLILASDNNFSMFQKTVFYAFEIIP